MRNPAVVSGLILILVLASVPVAANPVALFQDPPQSQDLQQTQESRGTDQTGDSVAVDEACELLCTVIETVSSHHISPPSKQQMAANVLASLALSQPGKQANAITERILTEEDPSQMLIVLRKEIKTLFPDGKISQGAVEATIAMLGNTLPGGLQWQDAKSAAVNQQLAANQYVGIGVRVGMNDEEERLVFLSVMEGGTAEQAGIQANDIASSINGVDTKKKPLGEIVELLRGPQESVVEIEVYALGSTEVRKYKIPRRVIPIRTVHLNTVEDRPDVAVLSIDSMTASCVHELRMAEARLSSDVKTVIVDLRMTQDSDLHNAHLFADALLDQVSLGYIETPNAKRLVTTEPGRILRNKRVIVVVSGATAPYLIWITQAMDATGIEVCLDSLNIGGLNPPSIPVRPPISPNVAFVLPMLPAIESVVLPGEHGVLQLATGQLLDTKSRVISPRNLAGRKVDRDHVLARPDDRRNEVYMQSPENRFDQDTLRKVLGE
ncbi:MAG: PDZ domain-containing protein [Planctomyces sp.]|nr:PDZ domain-containing protein [Planctomyces sp.]